MPTYMYRCESCGHRFEAVQTFDELPLETCPECQGPVRRVIGNVGVTFKGSGFYRTDSRAGNQKKPGQPAKSKTASESGSSAPSPSPSTSDKPASKPVDKPKG